MALPSLSAVITVHACVLAVYVVFHVMFVWSELCKKIKGHTMHVKSPRTIRINIKIHSRGGDHQYNQQCYHGGGWYSMYR